MSATVKVVNGVEVPLTSQEQAAIEAEWAANAPPNEQQQLTLKRARLKALLQGIGDVAGVLRAICEASRKAINQLRQNPTTTFAAISKQQMIDAVLAEIDLDA